MEPIIHKLTYDELSHEVSDLKHDNFIKDEEIANLKRRIIKAIYFIRDKGQYDEENNMYKNNVSFWELKELVNILEGEDNER